MRGCSSCKVGAEMELNLTGSLALSSGRIASWFGEAALLFSSCKLLANDRETGLCTY